MDRLCTLGQRLCRWHKSPLALEQKILAALFEILGDEFLTKVFDKLGGVPPSLAIHAVRIIRGIEDVSLCTRCALGKVTKAALDFCMV
jgi:hypothetical protein